MFLLPVESSLTALQAAPYEACAGSGRKACDMGREVSDARGQGPTGGRLRCRVDSSPAADAPTLGQAPQHHWTMRKRSPKCRSGIMLPQEALSSTSFVKGRCNQKAQGAELSFLTAHRSSPLKYDASTPRLCLCGAWGDGMGLHSAWNPDTG